jgi:hypothetical protein
MRDRRNATAGDSAMVSAALTDRESPRREIDARARLLLPLPVLAALAYPWLLAAISAVTRAGAPAAPPSAFAIVATTLAILSCAAAVMGLSAWVALSPAPAEGGATAGRARLLALLAFSAPSLLTAVGNVAGLMHARAFVAYIWPALWILTAAAVALAPATPGAFAQAHRRKLVVAHAVSACAILAVFLLMHLGNHLVGLWSGAAHIRIMDVVRRVYRNPVMEPVLVGLILFQIASGVLLLRRRMAGPGDLFGVIQALTGFYVAVYFVGHVIAAFSARMAGTDTNWNWLTGHDRGLLFHLSGSAVLAHYWVGPIAIVAHVACGLRVVAIEHGASPAVAGRAASGLIGLGVVASSAILAGLLGFHLA